MKILFVIFAALDVALGWPMWWLFVAAAVGFTVDMILD